VVIQPAFADEQEEIEWYHTRSFSRASDFGGPKI
jgi:hypothetical protein